eukprot:7735110-Pyramimonas_sp.AAC.1
MYARCTNKNYKNITYKTIGKIRRGPITDPRARHETNAPRPRSETTPPRRTTARLRYHYGGSRPRRGAARPCRSSPQKNTPR